MTIKEEKFESFMFLEVN